MEIRILTVNDTVEKVNREQSTEKHKNTNKTHSSGYGGDGKFNELHSYAANVTLAICGPKYNRNVCNPVPNPTDDNTPKPTQYTMNHKLALITLIIA